MLTVLVTFIPCGCSVLMARSWVSGRGELTNPKTRAEARDQFGKPDETRTCPDGRVVESRGIRARAQKQSSINLGNDVQVGQMLLYLAALDLMLADIPGMALALYMSEKLHYAFVYDEADRLLYVYDLTASPPVQFSEATRLLDSMLRFQLESGQCDNWTACITDFEQEVRRRAACLGYTLGADQEQAFERMFVIGEKVDSSRISREDGLAEIREPLYLRVDR